MDNTTSNPLETERLLERVRAGDRQAIDRLFALHRSYLKHMVEMRLDLRLRSRVDASDVVQQAQLDAFQRLPDYLNRRPMPFRLWLRKTAHERLIKLHEHHIDAARRSVKREVDLGDRSSLQLAQQLVGAGPTPSRQVARRELVRQVREAIAQLAETDREILLMRYVERMSNQEVGYVLELEPATVSKRHGRALLRMQKVLAEIGLTESRLD